MLEIQVDHQQSVVIELYHNNFVERWKQLFKKTVETCAVDQLESFSHQLTESQCQERLISAINIINQFVKKQIINLPQPEDWESTEWYNQLHRVFEQLSGSWGRPTRLFSVAPDHVKHAVRDLNFYVHRLEQRPYRQRARWFLSFNRNNYTRLPLEKSDYELFQFEKKPGEVYIHYAELGKTHYDLFKDGLDIDYPGLKNLHYYSAEIDLFFIDKPVAIFEPEFVDWAKKHKINPYDKTLGIGLLPIGKIKNLEETKKIAQQAKQITKLTIND